MRCVLALLPAAAAAAAAADDIPFGEFPMIMAHDAATGYLPGGWEHPINAWAKTQQGGFGATLDCGARSLDVRPKVKDGRLIMHHGDVDVDHSVADALKEVTAWCAANPAELVLLAVSDCEGDNCSALAAGALHSAGIPFVSGSACAELTLGNVTALSALPSGGHAVAVGSGGSCEKGHYDPSIQCYDHIAGYTCYGDDRAVPFAALWKYLNSTTAARPSGYFYWDVSAHWQYSAASIAAGVTHASSILKDESASKVNELFAQKIDAGWFPHMNAVSMDNVCDGGAAVLAAMRRRHARRVGGTHS